LAPTLFFYIEIKLFESNTALRVSFTDILYFYLIEPK